MKSRKIKYLLLLFLVIICFAMILNIRVTTKQGINYEVRLIKIPLYLKILDFFDRHYNYIELVRRITSGSKTEQEKIIKVFEWVTQNVKRNPAELPVMDDHPLNIIIRGYGVNDQLEDIFTILCTYAGCEAFYKKFSNSQGLKYYISFVRIMGEWYPFSAYYNVCPLKNAKLYCVRDILAEPSILSLFSAGIPNFEREAFLEELKNMCFKAESSRVKGQNPLGRLVVYIRDLSIKLKK